MRPAFVASPPDRPGPGTVQTGPESAQTCTGPHGLNTSKAPVRSRPEPPQTPPEQHLNHDRSADLCGQTAGSPCDKAAGPEAQPVRIRNSAAPAPGIVRPQLTWYPDPQRSSTPAPQTTASAPAAFPHVQADRRPQRPHLPMHAAAVLHRHRCAAATVAPPARRLFAADLSAIHPAGILREEEPASSAAPG